MKVKNTLYSIFEGFIGKKLTKGQNTLSYKFGISFSIREDEVKEVKRYDITKLYFYIVDTLITEETRRDLYDLRNYIRSVDKDGLYREKIESIIDCIYNVNEYKRI